ncbi:retrovirus-related pol polyprotein from transposon TNT 1-94 [Tanacetum coccineum]|uniref:Retrovirus-related pol polyprotein from transposon TNT 1-94 n=1 Tax=Tanacetum coccineum TaxID=301880 RepID=A0ABQ4YEA9_9ASTR
MHPQIIEELFKNYVQNNVIQVHPTTITSTETTSSADLQQQLYFKMNSNPQDQANDPTLWDVLKRKSEKSSTSNTSCRDDEFHSQRHDDHQEDDAPPKGGKIMKRQKNSKSLKSAREETIIDEDEVIPKDETPELITEFQNVDKRVPTIFDRARMEATLNGMLSNQFKNAEEVISQNNQEKAQTKSPSVPGPSLVKKADSSTKQLLLTLMEEVKGLKEQIKPPSDASISQTGSSKSAKGSMNTTLISVSTTLDVTSLVALLMKPLTVLRRPPPITGNQGLVVSDPLNPLKSGFIKETNMFQISVHDYLKISTQGTIFNQINEVVLIAPRRRDVYVIDMSSYNDEINACFFAKASNNVNWMWHKSLSQLNFKNINKLAKQNLVAGLPSLTFSKDKPCSACEKRKHHRTSFKTKRSFSINKCLHLLHIDLFGPVKSQTISHNKYTLVIVDEYSRYTWVFFLKKKSDAADCITSFIRKMENLNEVRVKELRSDNGTGFGNYKLEEFCDEKGISQNFSSPCTLEQNGVAERRNRTLIEATRTMLNSSKLPKQFRGEVVNTACYTQNKSIIMKRHVKTTYDALMCLEEDLLMSATSMYLVVLCSFTITETTWESLMKKRKMDSFLDTL